MKYFKKQFTEKINIQTSSNFFQNLTQRIKIVVVKGNWVCFQVLIQITSVIWMRFFSHMKEVPLLNKLVQFWFDRIVFESSDCICKRCNKSIIWIRYFLHELLRQCNNLLHCFKCVRLKWQVKMEGIFYKLLPVAAKEINCK